MKKLRQIVEVERSPGRAAKLLQNLMKRRKDRGMGTANVLPRGSEPRLTGGHVSTSIESIPLNKVKSHQKTIDGYGLAKNLAGKLNHTYDPGDPPTVIHNRETDEFHAIGGNHRLSKLRLLGKKMAHGVKVYRST